MREIKQRLHRQPQLLGDPLNRLERRRIDPALNQAQEIHGDADVLCKPLLAEFALSPK